MATNRRKFLAGLGGLAALGVLDGLEAKPLSRTVRSSPAGSALPAKGDFAIPEGVTFINSAYTHPMPVFGLDAVHRWLEARSQPAVDSWIETGSLAEKVRAEFAALINAKPSEISFVTNTSTGENFVVNGLGIPRAGGNVVTDALHFEGAILHLRELQKHGGLDLRMVMPRDWRIDLQDMERMVDKKTRLIELSLVAMDNGFQHDLKAVCDLAHAHGAYVYADIVQAAGNTPIDVRASNVDFCACSTFKWLMGDFGLGFLYVREDLLDRVIHRTQYGYFQASGPRGIVSHFLPGDVPAPTPYTFQLGTDANSYFEVGTRGTASLYLLAESLPYLRRLGVEKIQEHRQPMLKLLHQEMPRLGFQPITPPETTSALVSFAIKNPQAIRERLRRAEINVRVANEFLRVSPSVFNDLGDIEKLLEALG